MISTTISDTQALSLCKSRVNSVYYFNQQYRRRVLLVRQLNRLTFCWLVSAEVGEDNAVHPLIAPRGVVSMNHEDTPRVFQDFSLPQPIPIEEGLLLPGALEELSQRDGRIQKSVRL